MKQAIGYIRVSSDKQVKEGQGLEVQEKAIKKYCDENNINLVALFADEGISGAEDLEKRLGLGKALNLIKDGPEKIDMIIVQKWDRMARDTILLGYLEFELRKANCQIVATDQEFKNDPMGRLMKDIIAAFASFEKKMINTRTSSGKKNKIEKRLFTGGKIPLGYKIVNRDHLEIDETKSPIVEFIFRSRLENYSLRQIANLILQKFNFKIGYATIKYILNNPVYIGSLRQENEYFISVPSLIDKEIFDAVNKKL